MRSNVCGILFIILIPAIPPVWAGTLVNGRTMLSPQAQVDQRVFTAAFSTAIDAMADITADRGKGFFSDVEEGRGKEAREGYQQAIEFLRGKIVGDIPLTESDLLTLHKFLGRTKIEVTPELAMYIANGGMLSELSNANVPGEYRTSPLLGLQFLEHPLPRSIPQLMRALIEWMNEQDEQITRLEQEGADIKQPLIALAGRVHYLIGIIHPFTDGNGRVARLLTRYLLEKHGYEITGETREEYEVTFGRDFNHNFGIAYGTKRVNIEKATWPELLGKSDAPAFRQFLTKHIRDLSEETLAFYELLGKRSARYLKMRRLMSICYAGNHRGITGRGIRRGKYPGRHCRRDRASSFLEFRYDTRRENRGRAAQRNSYGHEPGEPVGPAVPGGDAYQPGIFSRGGLGNSRRRTGSSGPVGICACPRRVCPGAAIA